MKEKEGKQIINERFLEVISALKYSGAIKNDTDFAKKIGLNPSQISNIRTVEGKNVTLSIIESAVKTFSEINANYILMGIGKPLNESSDNIFKVVDRITSVTKPFHFLSQFKNLEEKLKVQPEQTDFGAQVEELLKREMAEKVMLQERLEEKDRQLMEKDRTIVELLKRIDPKQLGKVEVTDRTPEGIIQEIEESMSESVTQQQEEYEIAA